MPVLEILKSGNSLCLEDNWRVWAAMLYPKDVERQAHWIAYCRAEDLISRGETPSIDILQMRHSGPRYKDIEKDATKALNHSGRIAGQLLMKIRQLAEHHPNHASVNRAVYLLGVHMTNHQSTVRARLREKNERVPAAPFPAADGALRSAWSSHGPACHLWAAFCMTGFNLDGYFGNLRESLAASEWMRHFAETHIPRNRSSPLFDSNKLWRVPDDMALPFVDYEISPLTDEEMECLSEYRPSLDY